LDVCVFQPLKRWHSEAVNEAIQTGDETITKVEFLAAFNHFRNQAFKSSTVRSAWKKTGLIPYDPSIVLNKVRETMPRSQTPPRESVFQPLASTPKTVRQLAETDTELITSTNLPDSMVQPLARFARAIAGVRKAELLEARLDQTTAAENARKTRKRASNRVCQGSARH
jgi:hypothetical protein